MLLGLLVMLELRLAAEAQSVFRAEVVFRVGGEFEVRG